jgi:regulator of replication initiation timing
MGGREDTAAYIEQNHHLPDIPSAAEVKEKGVSVGEMESKLLAKIEELTLHMIKLEEQNERLELQNYELKDRVARVEGYAAVAR